MDDGLTSHAVIQNGLRVLKRLELVKDTKGFEYQDLVLIERDFLPNDFLGPARLQKFTSEPESLTLYQF